LFGQDVTSNQTVKTLGEPAAWRPAKPPSAHLHVSQNCCFPKHGALWYLEQRSLLIHVKHAQLAAHEDEQVATDLAWEVII
jgi:hypothetical protein